jgi:hypothetical protein
MIWWNGTLSIVKNSIAGTNANILLEEVFKKKSGSPWKNGTREESYKGPLMFTISTTPAPESSTYVLGAVMIGVLAFVHRYQARQKTAVKSAA